MIYGIGLPRTGSSTLAEALRLLGYSGMSYCGLHNDITQDTTTNFIVNNTFFNRLEAMYEQASKESKFILTTRADTTWNNSMNQFPEHTVIPKPSQYETGVKSLIPQEKLLIVNWEEGDEWQKLCAFLDVPVPYFDFPCKNC